MQGTRVALQMHAGKGKEVARCGGALRESDFRGVRAMNAYARGRTGLMNLEWCNSTRSRYFAFGFGSDFGSGFGSCFTTALGFALEPVLMIRKKMKSTKTAPLAKMAMRL